MCLIFAVSFVIFIPYMVTLLKWEVCKVYGLGMIYQKLQVCIGIMKFNHQSMYLSKMSSAAFGRFSYFWCILV